MTLATQIEMNYENALEFAQNLVEESSDQETLAGILVSGEQYHAVSKEWAEATGFEPFEEPHPWLVAVYWLGSNGFLDERDWKDPGEELISGVQKLRQISSKDIALEHLIPSSEVSLIHTMKNVDTALQKDGLRLLFLDIDSDSYPMIPVPAENIDSIRRLAKLLGHHVEIPGKEGSGWVIQALAE